MTTRFRLTVSTEWEADPKHYSEDEHEMTVVEMLAIDQKNAEDDPWRMLNCGDTKVKVVVEEIVTPPLTYREIQARLDAHPELIQRLSDGDTSAFEEILELAGAKIGTVTVRDVTPVNTMSAKSQFIRAIVL